MSKFKRVFQPLEIAFKKMLGIKKVKKGRIFDETGKICHNQEKITRYVLFVPFFQKIKMLVNVSNVPSNRGGGTTFCAILYTLKTSYKILGLALFSKISTSIVKTSREFSLGVSNGFSLGEYITTNSNIAQEIKTLLQGLTKQEQNLLIRQMARSKQCYENNSWTFSDLDEKELAELHQIFTEFIPQNYKLNENLYYYDGYFLPIDYFEISVFRHKHSLDILEPQTLAKMRQKDIIDAGGHVDDSAIIFEREFTDKKVYTFEPTQENYEKMLQTIKLNSSSRIVPIKKGLGATNSTMQMSISDFNYGIGSSIALDRGFGKTQAVEVVKLDDFVRENKIEVGFIKVDIEGFEMEFLKGAKETIMQQKPAMLISIYHQPSDYFGIKPLIESWNLGYKFKICKGVDLTLIDETVLFCEVL